MRYQANKTASYLRLSREDGDKLESDSITNQRELIREYVTGHEGLSLVNEYVDDGYSGSNYDRPSFKRLLEDVNAGKVNCIIVKDLSRLGRNYIETGRYLEKIFPAIGIRFISILDHYDSANENSEADQIIIPFKNLINDSYCRDISMKIRSQLDVKRRNGKFIGSFASYGYQKDPKDKNHLIIDPFAADIVRMIFRLKLDGYNSQRIAETLNNMGVLPPAEYKRSQGLNYDCGFKSSKNPKWEIVTINRILTSELYLGTMVQNIQAKISYKVKQYRRVPKDEWIKVEGMHEPIIERSVFDTVQKILQYDTRTAPDQDAVYPLSGFVTCGDCGQNMNRRQVRKGRRIYPYYHCSTYKSGNGCSSHLINADKVVSIVLETIQTQISLVLEAEKILSSIDNIPENQTYVKTVTAQIREMERETEKYEKLIAQAYSDMKDGIISEEEHAFISGRFSEKLGEAKTKVDSLKETKKRALRNQPHSRPWIDTFRKYQNIEKLERNIVAVLLEKVIIHDKNCITVVFRFQDEMQELLALAGLGEEANA